MPSEKEIMAMLPSLNSPTVSPLQDAKWFSVETVVATKVGDTDFQETTGIGARALEPKFAEQFTGLNAAEGGAFETISGATFTSKAILGDTNGAFGAMAEAILKIMDDPDLLKQLSSGARRLYREKFTARAMTEQLERLYEAACARSGEHGKE